MEQALDNLNIDINDELPSDDDVGITILRDDTCNGSGECDNQQDPLLEEMPAEEAVDDADIADETVEADDETTQEDDTVETPEDGTLEPEAAEDDAQPEDAPAAEDESEDETKSVDVSGRNELDLSTVGDAIELLQEYDDDTAVEFEAVTADGEPFPVGSFDSFIDPETDALVISMNGCDPDDSREGEAGEDAADSDIELYTDDEEPSVEAIEEIDDDEAAADDDGDAEVIESLKQVVRQKEALETEVNDLRKAKAVGDAKVEELQEKLQRYRTAFRNTSAEAAKVPELQSQVDELTEKLNRAAKLNERLTKKVNDARQLKESVEGGKATVARLNEQVSRLTKKSETLEAKLEGQTKVYTEKLQERTELARTYKARMIETLTRYVESKANMLGVQSSEITSRLNENYTLADVDAVCDKILDSTVNFSRLPFGGRTKTSARIAESVTKPVVRGPEYGYEIDDDLLQLAGLK